MKFKLVHLDWQRFESPKMSCLDDQLDQKKKTVQHFISLYGEICLWNEINPVVIVLHPKWSKIILAAWASGKRWRLLPSTCAHSLVVDHFRCGGTSAVGTQMIYMQSKSYKPGSCQAWEVSRGKLPIETKHATNWICIFWFGNRCYVSLTAKCCTNSQLLYIYNAHSNQCWWAIEVAMFFHFLTATLFLSSFLWLSRTKGKVGETSHLPSFPQFSSFPRYGCFCFILIW